MKNYVKVEAYILSVAHGWSIDTVWVPREVVVAESQDKFLQWVHSAEGKDLRETYGDLYAMFLTNFEFDERGTFAEKGVRVRIARDTAGGPKMFTGKLGECGVLQDHARIGKDTCPFDMADVLLDSGNEVTVMSHFLDFDANHVAQEDNDSEVLTPDSIVALGKEIYQVFYEGTMTFDGAMGRDLSYLMGAILKGTACRFGHNTTMMKFLRGHFPLDHMVWSFIMETP